MNHKGQQGSHSGEQSFRTVAILAVAFVLGPSLFGAVSLWLKGGSGTLQLDLFALAWAILAPAALLVAIVIWSRLVEPHLPRIGEPSGRGGADLAALQTGLITVWALIEGQALFGVVAYFLFDTLLPLAGLVLLWVAMIVSRPRRRWFGH